MGRIVSCRLIHTIVLINSGDKEGERGEVYTITDRELSSHIQEHALSYCNYLFKLS